MSGVLPMLAATGRGALALLALIGRMGRFGGQVVRWLLHGKPYMTGILEQAVAIGVNTVGILSVIMFFVGADVAIVGYGTFQQFGGQNLLGIYVGMSCVIGMAPIIVGAMLAAKPGTEITATIASMRVKEQLDALEVMAVNPFWFLIVPRFVAYLLVTPALVCFAYLTSIAGGYVAGVFQLGLNSAAFMSDVVRFLTVADLFKGMVRGEAFAIVICLMSCFFGYHSGPGAAGVSRAINMAVVVGSVAIIVINYFLTELMY